MAIIRFLMNGLTLGMTYALIAVGYSLVFGILRLINFSHGAMYALGAHVAMVVVGFRLSPYLGLLASVMFCGCIGVCTDKVALKPLRKKDAPPITSLITTVGLSYVIQNLLQIIFNTERKPFPNFYYFGQLNILGVSVSSASVIVLCASGLLLFVLTMIIYRTKTGLAMRAIQQNMRAARLLGINVNKVIMLTFFMAGVSAAIAGTLMAAYYQTVYSTMGFTIGLKAFSAAILGGIGNLYGSVLGGLIIGVTESFAAGYIGGTFRDSIAFIILILILLIKPTGLFGRKGVNKI
ncbi:MAG: branched-chain amino acid ABC transporter permease [Clostridiales bacterium]|nr:branched-chain amino acid ABC transporter permease [Clostridiales bacterium]